MADVWKEHKTPEGRLYYHNTQTQKTQWTKPQELWDAVDVALSRSDWKEHEHEGKKYWHNKSTKVTTWNTPDEIQQILSQRSSAPAQPPQPQYVAGGAPGFPSYDSRRERDDSKPPDRGYQKPFTDGVKSTFTPASNEPDYATFEEAETAFMKMLKRLGVHADWSWEKTLPAVVKDPQYRSIKDPKSRKAAFDKYVLEARIQEKQHEQERWAKLRDDFRKMLRSHPDIQYYTRWKTARPIVEGETIFRSTDDETERRQLFDEYTAELRQAHEESEAANHKTALDQLANLLHELDIGPFTRWADAQKTVESNEKFQNDAKFRSLAKLDVLTIFESHVKKLEQEANAKKQAEKVAKKRRERHIRDDYAQLLDELRSSRKIAPGVKWSDVVGLMEGDARYLAMLDLGPSSSDAIELFWEVLEEEDRDFRGKRGEALDKLDAHRFEMTAHTTLEEFRDVIKSEKRGITRLTDPDIEFVFHHLRDRILRNDAKDRDDSDKQVRRGIDDLRHRIRRLHPPMRLTDTWDDIRPRVEESEEYAALKKDDDRRAAFDKAMRRLKDKEEDLDYSRSRRDRDSHRYEPDAYEADRRRAQADRERVYRRTSGAHGLSPPGSARDFDRQYDSRRNGRLSARDYDREWERDHPRELDRPNNLGYSRADPRDKVDRELDYGDGGRAGSMAASLASSGNRRKKGDESEGEVEEGDRREIKRQRRSKTPTVSKPEEKEEENLKSGSEEGEIEEV